MSDTDTQYDDPFQRYSYRSSLIEELRNTGGRMQRGRVTVRTARTFGFCWGVDRAVAMVRDALRDYPDRRIWLLDQIIHNPQVNADFKDMGVRFVRGPFADASASEGDGSSQLSADDVVVIPAFSATVEDTEQLEGIGCTILDTTCPWVVRPHLRTIKYVEDGFTTVIHGLVQHEETRASCSLIASRGGQYLVVADQGEAERLCRVIRGELDAGDYLDSLAAGACSADFDPTEHLTRIGTINQTTMLASETREIEALIREAVAARDPAVEIAESFRELNTICRATQENQDSVVALAESGELDLLVVVGGFDSSNTRNLTRVGGGCFPSFHVLGPDAIEAGVIRHRCAKTGNTVSTDNWLPEGPISVGFTAGASTPDTLLGDVVEAVLRAAGERVDAAPSVS
ncbi:MAG: 4-hydroxy-3-methylbut-2-enyl diphosphate reductase [Planctomycetota bacterium]|nr:MAG: 4-hydroxy-3-methylbut-2-enyl diphosphate reductase [Planctomycetota bacterium]